MAIYQLLREASFGPNEIGIMTAAYELTLERLNLPRTHPLTAEIAKRIIEGCRSGQRTPWLLCKHALGALNLTPGEQGQTSISDLARRSRELLEATSHLVAQLPGN